MTYSEKLKDPRWQKKRLLIFQRDEFRCQYCDNDKKTLNVHHKKYNGNPWEANNDDLQTLCNDCHSFIEWIKKSDNYLIQFIFKIAYIDCTIIVICHCSFCLFYRSPVDGNYSVNSSVFDNEYDFLIESIQKYRRDYKNG